MIYRVLIAFFFVQLGFSQTKDTIASKEETTSKEATIISDTLIDGKSLGIKEIKPIDSIIKRAFQDNKLAAELDDRWLNELYNASLFDTIYKSVTELEYEEVYYPEAVNPGAGGRRGENPLAGN